MMDEETHRYTNEIKKTLGNSILSFNRRHSSVKTLEYIDWLGSQVERHMKNTLIMNKLIDNKIKQYEEKDYNKETISKFSENKKDRANFLVKESTLEKLKY